MRRSDSATDLPRAVSFSRLLARSSLRPPLELAECRSRAAVTGSCRTTKPVCRLASIYPCPVTVPITLTKIEHRLLVSLASGSKVAPHRGSIVATHTQTFVKTDAEITDGISIALARSFAKPEHGTPRALRNTFTLTVPEAEVVLSRLVTLASRERVPSHGPRNILRDTVPRVIASA